MIKFINLIFKLIATILINCFVGSTLLIISIMFGDTKYIDMTNDIYDYLWK